MKPIISTIKLPSLAYVFYDFPCSADVCITARFPQEAGILNNAFSIVRAERVPYQGVYLYYGVCKRCQQVYILFPEIDVNAVDETRSDQDCLYPDAAGAD